MGEMFKAGFSDFFERPKNIQFEGNDHDEVILFLVRRDIVTNLVWLGGTMFLLILPVFFNYLVNQIFPVATYIPATHRFLYLVIWYMFVFAYFFESYLSWYFNIYIVTTKRLVDVDFDGFLSRRISEAPLSSIEDVTYNVNGIFPNIFNFGDVTVQTASRKPEIEFLQVPRPSFLHDAISDLAAERRNNRANTN